MVHPCYPHLGASPDSIVTCDCCGKGVIEIKSPYLCRGKAFSEAADQDKDFCLRKHADGHLQLIESHAYYYQVQAQLKLCEAVYCDFVMWSMDELLVLQIFPDPEFIDGAIEEVTSFFKYGGLPELLGKWNTKAPFYCNTQTSSDFHGNTEPDDPFQNSSTSSDKWCYCGGPEEGQMICCDNKKCPIVWFHTDCLKIVTIPTGKWYCQDCRNLAIVKKTKKQT